MLEQRKSWGGRCPALQPEEGVEGEGPHPETYVVPFVLVSRTLLKEDLGRPKPLPRL